jgi:hypothetical protein
LLEAAKRPSRHSANVEWAAVVPRDEPLSDIRRSERLVFDEATSDAQRLVGVVRDRPSGLIPRAVPDHLVEPSVLSPDF